LVDNLDFARPQSLAKRVNRHDPATAESYERDFTALKHALNRAPRYAQLRRNFG
jgi:hypothetical protein